VGVLDTYRLGGWTLGFSFSIVIGTSWFALVVKSVCVAVEALGVLCHSWLTLSSHASVTVHVLCSNLALIRYLLTLVEVCVTLVSSLAVGVVIAATDMGVLAHWGGVGAVGVSGTACATFVSGALILFEWILCRAVETVFISIHITDGVKPITFTVHLTHRLTSIVLTVVTIKTVSIRGTSTSVGILVTYRCRVFTVQCTVMATFTTSVIGSTVSATEKAVVIVCITDLVISITFSICCTLCYTSIVLTIVTIKTVCVIGTSTSVGILVTNRCRVFTIQSTVMATLTTSIIGSTVSSTEKAVVIVCITDLVISITFSICSTYRFAGIVLAEVTIKTVRVCSTSTSVGILVTYRCRVFTIQCTVMATFTTSIVRPTIISSTVETVVIVCITNLVISITEVISVTDSLFTEMSVIITMVAIRTVLVIVQSSTSSKTFSSFSTVGTVLRVMGSRNIANSVIVVTIGVLSTLTGSRVDTLEEDGTVTSITHVTVSVLTTFILRKIGVTHNPTFNIGWPVTDWSHRIFITGIKC